MRWVSQSFGRRALYDAANVIRGVVHQVYGGKWLSTMWGQTGTLQGAYASEEEAKAALEAAVAKEDSNGWGDKP